MQKTVPVKQALGVVRRAVQAAGVPLTSLQVADEPVATIHGLKIPLQGRTPRDLATDVARLAQVLQARTPLEAYLAENGLSYADVKASTGLSRGILQKYATGVVSPSLERREIIAIYTSGQVGIDDWPQPAREAHRPGKEAA
jgi:hypothetical protein